jgi:hypothetical protein
MRDPFQGQSMAMGGGMMGGGMGRGGSMYQSGRINARRVRSVRWYELSGIVQSLHPPGYHAASNEVNVVSYKLPSLPVALPSMTSFVGATQPMAAPTQSATTQDPPPAFSASARVTGSATSPYRRNNRISCEAARSTMECRMEKISH